MKVAKYLLRSTVPFSELAELWAAAQRYNARLPVIQRK
jgi:hypothetical protein